MPLSTTQYGFIIDPMVPFTDASGTTIRNGYVRVFVAGSSTPVITYKNYDGATNEETIQLDNSGRTAYPVIVSKGNTYKVCVYDAEHSQESPIFTIDKVVPAGANVEATNIVTGLDNVESPEAGWVKSTVSGTDAEVSLDATNVTSEVDTLAKATAASADYMMPLVHKTGSGSDKKITLGNILKFVLDNIVNLATTITSFASGDYFVVGRSTGAVKMSKDSLLKETAQNALSGNVAPAFDSTRTSENPYKAGESVTYEGKIYTFKVDHYGAWVAGDVEELPLVEANVFNLSTKDAQSYSVESGFYQTNQTSIQPKTESLTYVCAKIRCKAGDKFMVVGQGATAALLWATAKETGQIVRKSAANAHGYINPPTIVTIEDGEDLFIFNSAVVHTLYDVRRLNTNEALSKIEARVDSSFAKEKIVYSFKVASGTSARMSFYYTPATGEKVFKLKKLAHSQSSFSVLASDSSGTNPNYEFLKDVPFDVDLYLVLPAGYDRWLFYKSNMVSTGIDVELIVPANSIASDVELLNSQTIKGKNILCFGDSITQFKYQGKGYTDYLAIMSGANLFNAGIGGTRYSLRATPSASPSAATEAWACLDMYNLVHSWLNSDWTTVDAGVAWLTTNEDRGYLANIVSILKNLDIDDVDVITLFAGTNDWSGSASKGAIDDNDPSTLLGSISLIITELLAAKPSLKLFVYTPTVRWLDYSGIATSNPDNFSDVKTNSGRTLKELAGWIAEGVQSLHIPVCDLYNALGWNQYNFSAYFLDTDGTHPYKGFDSLAKKMYGFMTANNW